MVAIPITIEFIAYTEEHAFFEQMTWVGGDLDIIKEQHVATLSEVLDIDNRLSKVQQGWSQVLVERVR
jgi:hypothetical protein